MIKNLPLMPDQASSFAAQSDLIYWALTLLTVAFTLIVFAALAFLAIRYRRGSKADRSRPLHGSHLLELGWTFPPLVLGLLMFVWSAKLFSTMYGRAPEGSEQIYVIGKQWMWHLQHMNGIRENNELHIPVGKPVKLTMISQDVIHSFFIPAFRIKRDVVPGVYTSIWFEPTRAGKYHLFCAEYCGTQHSEMGGWIYVEEPAEYQKWLASGGRRTADTQPLATTMEAKGLQLYEQQGCGNCHDADGLSRGPSLAGLFGTTVKLKNGATAVADEAYIRKSILEPNDQIADKYQQRMPSYKGQITEEQILDLMAYIRSIGPRPSASTTATPVSSATSGTRVHTATAGKPNPNLTASNAAPSRGN
ncbi:MAG: cytochrome c oxidase subunit II [Chthonomonadales bacterium]